MGWFGRRRKKKEKEPEGAQAEEQLLVPTGPELLVLVPEVAGAPTFQVNRFRVHDDATRFVRTVSPELLSSAHVFWALNEGPPPGVDPAGGEALVLIRAAAGRESVHVVSFVDLESAESFARFEVKRGLDLAFVMIYWAAFCQLIETPFGIGIDPLRPPDTRKWRAAMIAAAHAAPQVTTPDDRQATEVEAGDGHRPEPHLQPETPRSTHAEPVAVPAYTDADDRPPPAGDVMPKREPVIAMQHGTVAGEPPAQPHHEVGGTQTTGQPDVASEAEFRTEPEPVHPTPELAELEAEPRHKETRAEEPVTARPPEFEPNAAAAEAPKVIAESEVAEEQQPVTGAVEPTVVPEHIGSPAKPAVFGAESPKEDILAEEPLAPPPEFEASAAAAEAPEIIAEHEAGQNQQPDPSQIDAVVDAEALQPTPEIAGFETQRRNEEASAEEAATEPSGEFEPDAAVVEAPRTQLFERFRMLDVSEPAREDTAVEPEPVPPTSQIADFETEPRNEEISADEPATELSAEFEPDTAVAEAPRVIAESEVAEDQQPVTGEIDTAVEPEPMQPMPEIAGFETEPKNEETGAEEANAQTLEEPLSAESLAEARAGERSVKGEGDEAAEEPVLPMHDAIGDRQDTLEASDQSAGPDLPATEEPGNERQPVVDDPAPTEGTDQGADESLTEPSELAAQVEEAAASTNGHHADELIPEEESQDPVVSTEGDEEVAERLLTEALGAASRDGDAKHAPRTDEPVIARAQLFERFRMLDVSDPAGEGADSSDEQEERKGRKGKKKAKGKAKASAKGNSRGDSSGDGEDEEETVRVDVSDMVERTLRVKRWTKQDEPFRGFDSPPGRF